MYPEIDMSSWAEVHRDKGKDALNGEYGSYICSMKYYEDGLRCDCYIFEDIVIFDQHSVFTDVNLEKDEKFSILFTENFICCSSKEVYDINPEYNSEITSMLL